MKGSRGATRYRAIDLTLFAVMLCVFESVLVTASTRWFPNEPYTVSVTAAITAIVMMRWGPWAALHAVLGGAVHVGCARLWSAEAAAAPLLIFCVGNLFGLGALPLLKAPGAERMSVCKSTSADSQRIWP